MKDKITTKDIDSPYMKILLSELEKIVGSKDYYELTKRENMQKLFNKYNKVNELFVDIIGQEDIGVSGNHIVIDDKNIEDQIHKLPPKQRTLLHATLSVYFLVLYLSGMKDIWV
jgi:hypothetical protein